MVKSKEHIVIGQWVFDIEKQQHGVVNNCRGMGSSSVYTVTWRNGTAGSVTEADLRARERYEVDWDRDLADEFDEQDFEEAKDQLERLTDLAAARALRLHNQRRRGWVRRNPHLLARKTSVIENISRELSNAYPGATFSVVAGNGASAIVSWKNGPTELAVRRALSRFVLSYLSGVGEDERFFDSWAAFTDSFGGVQYIITRRTVEAELKAVA